MNKQVNDRWYGILTPKNIEEVANFIQQMLLGKVYTFVSVYEYKNFVPETHTDQQLKSNRPVSVFFHESGEASFTFSDTYGVWGCDTFSNCYIKFNYYQITIQQLSPNGLQTYWQITIQGEE